MRCDLWTYATHPVGAAGHLDTRRDDRNAAVIADTRLAIGG
jgi:hypothetical protein